MPKVAIIGGGAAGMACAIAAAREGAEAHVYERADRVGKKLLVTGNGRCNMSNTDIMSSDYNDPEFVQEAMNVLLSLIHISEPTRRISLSRMPSSA